MMGRNKRGIRRASMRARLAVAAAVIVGGGAAAVVAVAASHSGTATAQSAGYYTNSWGYSQTLSETQALSSAMNGWDKSPSKSLMTLAEMKPMSTFSMTSFHTHTLAVQRGTVLAASRNQFVIKSSNHMLELWNVNHGTKFLNVGGSHTGMAAMTGDTMGTPSQMNQMNMNMKTKDVTKGDMAFIFGERVHGKLVAQLVLFVDPMKTDPVTTPSMTTSPSMTATPTATPSMTTSPTMTATPTATPSATTTTPNTTVNGTPAVDSTHM
jgi:hypothetical protein